MQKKIFLICAEQSGNNILDGVLEQIKINLGNDFDNVELKGIVYDETAKKFNIQQTLSPQKLAVLGIGDILTKIPELLDNIFDTANEILNFKPDLVISVDAYDFCFRVARKVQKKIKSSNNPDIKKIKMFHIVAPSVWAYLPGRAKNVAKYFNHLFYLLPFETKYFKPYEKYENKQHNIGEFLTTFVGFPATFQTKDKNIKKNELSIIITVGSREGEIRRHQDVIMNTIMMLKMMNANYKFYILATTHTQTTIQNMFKNIKNIFVISDEKEKKQKIQESILAIAKSGTNNIEIGALGTPMITYYKCSPITFIMSKIFAKIKLINLFNITLEKMAIPELHQNDVNAENITKLARQFLLNEDVRKQQLNEISLAIKLMQREDKKHPINVIGEKISCFLKNDIQ